MFEEENKKDSNVLSFDDALEKEKTPDVVPDKPKRSPFVVWTVGGVDYHLKLTTKGICQLESKTKRNLLSLIEELPPLNVMCGIIQASLQRYHHGMKFNQVESLVEEYFEEGGSQLELFTDVIIPIFQVSGFFSVEMGQTMNENVEMAKANI
nr:MAG TPA: tail assembly chaperone protein [Caudoviricetes sp.]